MRKKRESLRRIVLGDSEQGKSHWLKAWVDEQPATPPILIWDSTFEWAGPSADRPIRAANCFRSVGAACRALASGAQLSRIVFQCGIDNHAEFERLCKLAFDAGDVTLLVDEAHIYARSDNCPPVLLTLVRVSRHRRVNVIFVAQRPYGLHVDIRTQCNETVLFHLSNEDALAWVRRERSAELAERCAALRPREWVHWRGSSIVAVSTSASTCARAAKKSRVRA